MIIGAGDIAKSVIDANLDREDVTFFASGVSDSSTSDLSKFRREIGMLMKMPRYVHLVYFSTLSIYYGFSPYIAHKKKMEQEVKCLFNSYTIVRIGNISWGTNPNTLINFITNKIKANGHFEVQDVYRYILDKDDFIHWMKMIPIGVNNEMNLTGHRVWVPDLVEQIRKKTNTTS